MYTLGEGGGKLNICGLDRTTLVLRPSIVVLYQQSVAVVLIRTACIQNSSRIRKTVICSNSARAIVCQLVCLPLDIGKKHML